MSVLTSCFLSSLAFSLPEHIIKYMENILNISVKELAARHMKTHYVPTVKGSIACVLTHIGVISPMSCVCL